MHTPETCKALDCENTAGPFHTQAPTSPLFIYADLSTAHLPQKEFEDIGAAPPRVIKHEFGAWVNVTAVDDTEEGWDDFPALLAVLQWADEQGARWVNFDQDGEFVSVLDTWEW